MPTLPLALRVQLAAAVAERAEVYARSGDRQRAAVAAAARDFCAVASEERSAGSRGWPRWWLIGRCSWRSPGHRAAAMAAVPRHLAEVNGQLPTAPSAEELERFRQMTADRERQRAELRNRADAGPRPMADNERVPVGTDHFGNPIDAHRNPFVPRRRMPHPRDV